MRVVNKQVIGLMRHCFRLTNQYGYCTGTYRNSSSKKSEAAKKATKFLSGGFWRCLGSWVEALPSALFFSGPTVARRLLSLQWIYPRLKRIRTSRYSKQSITFQSPTSVATLPRRLLITRSSFLDSLLSSLVRRHFPSPKTFSILVNCRVPTRLDWTGGQPWRSRRRGRDPQTRKAMNLPASDEG